MSSSDSNNSGETAPASSPPAPPSSKNESSSSPSPESPPPSSSPSPPSGSSPPSSSPSPPSGSSSPSNHSASSPSPSPPSDLIVSDANNGGDSDAPPWETLPSGPFNHTPALRPPSSKSSSRSKMSHSGEGNDLSSIIAISAVGALLFTCLIIMLVCFLRKLKKSKVNTYMTGFPGKVNDNEYNRTSPQKQHGDHFGNMPPRPGAVNGVKHWQAQPSPPALANQSSGVSSSNFSGLYGPLMPPPPPSAALGFNQSTFTYEELLAATGGFAQANLLGEGGFGYVHKGVLPNGKEIAVKSLKATSGQGDREFQAEIEIINRVHHRYLVSLVGYCISGEKKLLVYEFVRNKTLEYHLHGKGTPVMDWPTRLKIAIGAGKGFAYLHEDCHPRIIHRDIKAANILLEHNFDPKVADFGLAKLNQDNSTHVSTRVMGTFGYLAPEYASSGKLTDKSDVFSFGIMLLELITGRPPLDATGQFDDSLVDWARPLCIRAMETGIYDELVDPRLENNYNKHEMSCMVVCASASIRHSAKKRPKMSQIIRVLEGDLSLDNLNEGLKSSHSSVYSSVSSEYDSSSYSSDIKKFRKLALSEDEVSSEYARNSDL